MPRTFHYQELAEPPPQSLDIPSAVTIDKWFDEPRRRVTKRRQRNGEWFAYAENPNTWPSNYEPTPEKWESVTLKQRRIRKMSSGIRAAGFDPKEFVEEISQGVNIIVARQTIDIVVPRQVIDIVDFEY